MNSVRLELPLCHVDSPSAGFAARRAKRDACHQRDARIRLSGHISYSPTPAPPLEGRGTAAALSATGARRHIPDLWSPIPADAPTRSLSRSLSYSGGEVPIVISSGYRSEAVNMKCGGAKGSNHLTGCAVDIRCYGPEHMIRMAGILLDIADENGWVFDELIQEQRGTTYWVHFAVRPKNNRRKILFDCR